MTNMHIFIVSLVLPACGMWTIAMIITLSGMRRVHRMREMNLKPDQGMAKGERHHSGMQ